MIKDRCVNELGFEQVNIDNVGNIIATKGSGEPYILLCGHMDTVPGQVPVRIEDGYLYGRGASDAKSPLIAMLLAASEFPKQSGTVIFAGVVDEEGNATGIKQLVKSKIGVHYAVFGEPSGVDNITVAYKGRLELRLTCDVGESAHASAPWLARNSIEEMYDFWKEIKSEVGRVGAAENNAKSISCSLTEITGGSSHNVTPQKCKVTIDIRVPPITTCGNVLGTTDDMNVLGHSFKIPVITYGPGDAHASHTADERVNIDEYVASIEVYKRALFHLSRLHHLKKKEKKE